MKERNRLLVIRWTIGLLGGSIFLFLRATKRVKVQGWDWRKLDPKDRGLLLISNHLSLWEPALLPFLFFPWYLFSLRFVPFSVVDRVNYYDARWFWPLRSVCEPIERGNPREEIGAIDRMREILNQGKILILYPEGGRTFKGTEFKFLNSGKKIRKFPQGIRRLFLDTQPMVLPVWIEGGDKVISNKLFFPRFPHFPLPRLWRQTRIKIGESFRLEGIPKKEIVVNLEDVLLKLGDEV